MSVAIGNAYACTGKEGRAQFKEESHLLFDLIVQDMGSDMAFLYATGIGYGSSLSKDKLDCPTLLKQREEILDNLSSHKSACAAEVLKSIGAWFPFLPAYSPDLNPIEMAFAKLKALIRKAAARSYDALWQAVGHVCDLFSDEECYNYFKAAGYEAD